MSSRINISMRILLTIAITVGALLAVTVPALAAVPIVSFRGVGTLSGTTTLGASEAIQLTGSAAYGPITAWAWTFGDGGTSTLQSTSHTYTSAGTYTVALSATNTSGSTTLTKTNYITVLTTMSHTVNLSLTPTSQTVVGPTSDSTFTVTIAVTPSTGQAVAGVDAYVSFDPAVLQVDSIVMATGSLLPTDLTATEYFNNTTGEVNFSAGKLSGTMPSTAFDLATITFHSIATATASPITFSTAAQNQLRVTIAAFGGEAVTGTITGTSVTTTEGNPINGLVALQGNSRPPSGRTVPIVLKLFPPNTPNSSLLNNNGLLATHRTNTIDTGTNTAAIQINAVPGTYDILVYSAHTLANVKRSVMVSEETGTINFGTLLEGDTNNDGQINTIDFSILASSYLRLSGQTNFDNRADYDRTGIVNALDFTLLAANYLKTSPQEVP